MIAASSILQAAWRRLRSRFLRDVGALTVARFAGAALSLTQGILVARWLGPEQYGTAALVMTYPAVLFSFLDAKSGAAGVKYISEFEAKGEAKMALAMCKLGYGIDAALAAAALAVVAATAWWAEEHVVRTSGVAALMVVYAAALLPRALTGMSNGILSVLGRFQVMAWTDLTSTAVRVAAVLGLAAAGWGVSGVVYGNALGLAVHGILSAAVAYVSVRSAWGGSWPFASVRDLRDRAREIASFVLYVDLTELLGSFSKKLDVVLLGFFRGPEEVGLYRLAKSFSGNVGLLVGPLQSVAYPRLARSVSDSGTHQAITEARRLVLGVGAPMGLAVLASVPFVPFVLPLLVGRAFEDSIIPTQLLLGAAAVWLFFFWLRPLYYATGSVRDWAAINTGNIAVLVSGFLVVTPIWGVLGMAAWLAAIQVCGHIVLVGWLFSRPAARGWRNLEAIGEREA